MQYSVPFKLDKTFEVDIRRVAKERVKLYAELVGIR